MKMRKRLLSLLLAFCMVLPGFGALADDSCTVAFLGHTTLIDELRVPYCDLLRDYLSERVGKTINTVKGEPIDFGSPDFMNSLTYDILPQNPDIVFMEINISRRYAVSDDDLTARLESMVLSLCEGGKVPAIYFIYTPMDTLMDYREPYDRVAKRYGITVIDAFRYFKTGYERGQYVTRDFLSAGEKPAEEGQDLYVRAIENDLKDVPDILKSINTDETPLSGIRYKATEPAETGETEVSSDGIILWVDGAKGNDKNPGTEQLPLKTPEAARDKIRTLKSKQGADFRGATVYIREGLYTFSESFNLGAEDSATDDTRIVYKAYGDEEVRFTNARVLKAEDFSPVTDKSVMERFHTNGLGHILQYNLKGKGIDVGRYLIKHSTPHTLFEMGNPSSGNVAIGNLLVVNGRSEEHARWPNGGFALIADHQDADKTHFAYSGTKVPERWVTNPGQAYIKNVTRVGYFTFYNRYAGTDAANGYVNCTTANTYAPTAGWVWSAVNMLEELDVPGEMCVDETSGILYYYPRDDFFKGDVLFAGNILTPVVKMEKTKNITLENIIIEGSNGLGVEITDATANIIDGCTLRNLGTAGVKIINSGNAKYGKNGIRNCHFYRIYGGGVYISGGDRVTLQNQNDYVYNCHFEDYCVAFHHGSGAVQAREACGVDVYNNLFQNDDTTSIGLYGINLSVKYNEFSNIVKESDDTGAIYGQGDGITDQGAFIENNYFHDIVWNMSVGGNRAVSVTAIYPDAMATAGTEVKNNVFVRTDAAFFNNTSRNQTVSGNLSLDGSDDQFVINESFLGDADSATSDEITINAFKDGTIEDYRGKGSFTPLTGDSIFYYQYLRNTDYVGDNVKNYLRQFPWLERYFDKSIFRAGDLIMEKNAVYNIADGGIPLKFGPSNGGGGTPASDTLYLKNNYVSAEDFSEHKGANKVETDLARIDAAMADAKKNIPGFEAWDVRKAGLIDEPKPIGNYEMVSPVNGQKEVDISDLRLSWDYASGADEYYVDVATDKEFKNIVFSGKSNENYILVSNLEQGSKVYYWRVRAGSLTKSFYGSPAPDNGPYFTFTTMRYKEPERKEILATLEAARALYDSSVEGTEPGQYESGSREIFLKAIESAQTACDNNRVEQNTLNKASKDLRRAHIDFLTKVNLAELDVMNIFGDINKIDVSVSGVVSPAVLGDGIAIDSESFTLNGNGMYFSREPIGSHNILHFTGKLDFADVQSSSKYFVVGMDVQNHGRSIWNITSYLFLVTKDAIELQSFKMPANVGRFYFTTPNKYLADGREHDIEFATIPVSRGMRIILRIDGEVVYDYTDEQNFIEGGGDVEIFSSVTEGSFTIKSPKKDLGYPSLYEQLKDNPEAQLLEKGE